MRVTSQTKCPAGHSKVFSTVHVTSLFVQISLTNPRLVMLHALEEKLSRALVQDVTRTVEKSPHQNRLLM